MCRISETVFMSTVFIVGCCGSIFTINEFWDKKVANSECEQILLFIRKRNTFVM